MAEEAEVPPRPFAELRESGLLWWINRHLHTRGYALAVHLNDSGDATGWSLLGDGTEPWKYLSDPDEDRLFAAFEATLKAKGPDDGSDN